MEHLANPYIPPWAEEALSRPKPFDKAELEALRIFFASWLEFHAMKNDKLHHRKKEALAQDMVEKAMEVQKLQNPGASLRINGRE